MKSPNSSYNHESVEAEWQKAWQRIALDTADINNAKRPYFNLMMFPYPSAEGLHVGNMYAFTGSDINGRFKRMQGYDVFEPIGLDGFGIHSENYALKIGRHPADHAVITEQNFYKQLHTIGAMFDWTRTVETYDPGYYSWTQWLFVQMFKHGLAYRTKAKVNYCPGCKTVVADEQVIDGVCERCGNKIEKRLLEQWFFRITAYAEKLLSNIPALDWSEVVKTAQTHWLGKKEGIEITYPVVDTYSSDIGWISCFTTRPDTNFGATFVVIAPEHPFVSHMMSVLDNAKRDEIGRYIEEALKRSDQERISEGRKKTGVSTGLFAINQLNGSRMPLYVSDFVLMGFGTGAVVGVPGHDLRDFEFAQEFHIPVIRVVVGEDGVKAPITSSDQVQEDDGIMTNSEFLNGMDIHTATNRMMDYLEQKGWGKRVTTYHLRDWIVSRQRYWGPPIPMIYCASCAKAGKSWFTTKEASDYQSNKISARNFPDHHAGINTESEAKKEAYQEDATGDISYNMNGWYPVSEKDLPLILPKIDDYKPGDDGVAPLAKHKEFYETKCPGCGGSAVRETDVSDTFLDSSWYFLRYPSVQRTDLSFDPTITKKWLPVSMYTGGAEHSVLHLLYSRFVTMALHTWGYVDFDEPFPVILRAWSCYQRRCEDE